MKKLEYHLEGDYYIPNLVLPEEEKLTLNRYGRMRLDYLKEHKRGLYTELKLTGKLQSHLAEIQETAQRRLEAIVNELKAQNNLTEEMKDTDMLNWVGTMNSIKNQVEEIVLNELIFV